MTPRLRASVVAATDRPKRSDLAHRIDTSRGEMAIARLAANGGSGMPSGTEEQTVTP